MILALFAATPMIVACDQGPVEEAGDSVDEASEEVSDEIDDMTEE